jgi:hypothetical protein
MSENLLDDEPSKVKRRGRPPGTRNGHKLTPLSKLPNWSNYTTPPKMDYRHEDIETLVGRQLSMVGLAQDRVREEMIGYDKDGNERYMGDKKVTCEDIERLLDLSATLVRSIDALQKATKVAEELRSKLTPEEVLEAAIKKIESQDLVTLSTIIQRLGGARAKNKKANKAAKTIGAADALADLEKD